MPIDLVLPRSHPARTKIPPKYLSNESLANKLTPATRELFERYSNLDQKLLEAHIYTIRDEAWDIFPWASTGGFWFIEMGLSRHPMYDNLLQFLKTPKRNGSTAAPTFLDLGTGLGQDLRKLHYDGAPINTLYGCDVVADYEELGHKLFRDYSHFTPGHFIVGDIFSGNPQDGLYRTRGSWSVVNITMFAHNFSMAEQELIFDKILGILLRPKRGSVVIGTQTGTIKPGEMKLERSLCRPERVCNSVFRHSKQTLIDMWQRVAERAGIKVSIWADWDRKEMIERQEGRKADPHWEKKNRSIVGKSERMINFMVQRLE